MNCECCITEDGIWYICPMHYGRLLQDSTIKYGLATDEDTYEELKKKLGLPKLHLTSYEKHQ